jgi:DNA-directed RNA polymerase subunit omega
MARITVEDCLENVPNRFTLVLVTAERTKQLMKGSKALIEDDRSNKEIVTALREIAAAVVQPDMTGFDENEQVDKQLRPGEASSVADEMLPPAADELPPEA